MAAIAFCTNDVHRRLRVRHQCDRDLRCAGVTVRIGDGVLKADRACLARCRGIGEGAVVVVHNAASGLCVEAIRHQHNASAKVDTVCALRVVAQRIDDDRGVFCRLRHCVVRRYRYVVHNFDLQRSVGCAAVAVGHNHREVVAFRHSIHVGGSA